MTGLDIGSIKARDEISEVVVIAFRTRLLDTFVLVNLRHRRWTEVTVFTPFCLFVCVFVTCEKIFFFASMLVCLFVQTFVCLFVARLEPTVLIGTI